MEGGNDCDISTRDACVNSEGSFACYPCTQTCDQNAGCWLIDDGNSMCSCDWPYEGDGTTCLCGGNTCDENAFCPLIEGERTCVCNAYYEGDGITCTPVGP